MRSPFTREYKFFLEMLIDERKKANIKQTELAELLDTHQPFISKFETGERRLDVVEFMKIANAIGFDPDKFIKKLHAKMNKM